MYRGMARALAEAEEIGGWQAEGGGRTSEGVCEREARTRGMVMVALICFQCFEVVSTPLQSGISLESHLRVP
jgi:hypothetical protein